MGRTIFTPGSRVTADFLNSIGNPVFDGVDADGHRGQITDDELSDIGIKKSWNEFSGGLRVTAPVSGTAVNIAAGNFQLTDGTLVTKLATTLALPSDGVFYVYADATGTYTYSTQRSPVELTLAQVTTTGGAVATNGIIDLRPRYRVSNLPITQRVFGGQGSEKSLKVKGSGTPGWDVGFTEYTAIGTVGSPYGMTGEHWYNNLTIEAGAYVSVSGGAQLYCAGNVNIAGDVTVSAPVRGGGSFTGTVMCPSDIWSSGGQGIGGGNGHLGIAPSVYNYFLSPVGSGGASSYLKVRLRGSYTLSDINETISLSTGMGGAGGGAFILEAGGTLTVGGIIRCNGGAGTNASYTSGLTTATQQFLCSGAGGGSGGLIWLKSAKLIVVTGTTQLEVRGGNGGTGFISTNVNTTFRANPGGGGGGGYVVLTSPNFTTTGFDTSGTTNVKRAGGVKGSLNGTGANGLSGSTGGSFGGAGGLSDTDGAAGQFLMYTYTPV